MKQQKELFVFEVCYPDIAENKIVPVTAEDFSINDYGSVIFEIEGKCVCCFSNFIYVRRTDPKRIQPSSDFTKLQLQLVSKIKKTTS
jgi:hypothetical protein